MQPALLFLAAVLGVVGFAGLLSARERQLRYAAFRDALAGSEAIGDDPTVSGTVEVDDSAVPEQSPPPEFADGASPGLWAWRVRRKVRAAGQRTPSRWTTANGGLAVGEIAVWQGVDRIRIDHSWLTAEGGELDGLVDPFETPFVCVGKPDVSLPLGRLDPMTQRLERWAIAGEDGVLNEIGFSRPDRGSMTPDRYQATVLREGDHVAAYGDLDETGEEPVLRGNDDAPLVLVFGDPESRLSGLRRGVLGRAGIGAGLLLAGGLTLAVSGI
ncbi:hypothetical protein [Natronomonas sp.]|uniref:hypothetical protein n=1 Tax=Natronomonas sp. TaxID=2184060 RepID=UPI003976AB26